jgi:hypothetical protein
MSAKDVMMSANDASAIALTCLKNEGEAKGRGKREEGENEDALQRGHFF